jgi:hypothetical protein
MPLRKKSPKKKISYQREIVAQKVPNMKKVAQKVPNIKNSQCEKVPILKKVLKRKSSQYEKTTERKSS